MATVAAEDVAAETDGEHVRQKPGADAERSTPRRWAKGNLVGEGTYGQVYRALNHLTGVMFAAKQVRIVSDSVLGPAGAGDDRADLLEDDNPVDELQREVALMKRLQHKHIVK